MSTAIGAGLGVLAATLLLALAREWRRYFSGHHIISRPQLVVRVTTCALLVGQLVMVAVGLRLHFTSFDGGLAYWGVALALAALAMGLAVWDLRQVRRYARRRRAESLGRMSAYIRRLERGRGAQPSGQ